MLACSSSGTTRATPCASPLTRPRPRAGRRGMRFFADPELAYERGTFYLFATTDGHGGWSGWQICCLASEDLTHWQDRGVVIDLHDQHLDGSGRTNILPRRHAGAALAVRDGRYYLYFCGDGQTNVAVSDHIDGGYALQGDLARTSSHAARHWLRNRHRRARHRSRGVPRPAGRPMVPSLGAEPGALLPPVRRHAAHHPRSHARHP